MDFAVARYTQDGALDASFSGDGWVTTDIYGGMDNLTGLALLPDGKVLVGGTAESGDGSVEDFALARYNADGTPDFSFGFLGTGVVTTDFDGTTDRGNALALQSVDGRVVLGGTSGGALALARYWY